MKIIYSLATFFSLDQALKLYFKSGTALIKSHSSLPVEMQKSFSDECMYVCMYVCMSITGLQLKYTIKFYVSLRIALPCVHSLLQ